MKIFKISSIFNLLYLGVIISFLYVFYTAEDIYRQNIDNLEVVESTTVEFPLLPKRNRSLDISYKGISFSISKNSPVSITSRDEVVRKSTVINTSYADNRIVIELENQVVLNIKVDNRGQRLTIGTNIPKVFPTIKEITIPFTLEDQYTIEKNDLSYKISGNGDEFHLKLNDNYYINEGENRIHLTTDDDKISNLTFSPLDSSDLDIAEQWYKTFQNTEKSDLQLLVESYLNKVVRNAGTTFNSMRYNSQNNSWQNVPAQAGFSEQQAIIYLAEGLKGSTYITRRDRIEELQRRYPSKFSFESTPYIGNLVLNGKREYTAREEELKKVQTYIRYADEELFNTWIPDYYFDSDGVNMLLLEIGVLSKDPSEMNLNSLGVTLNNLLKIEERVNSSSNLVDRIKEVTDLIIQRIQWDEMGLFLIEDDDISYMDLNLKIGQLLINASQHDSNKYSKIIGETLIETYVNNSDRVGNTPVTYDIKNQQFSVETIPGEESYIKISDNEFLPNYYQKDGITIWSISNSIDVTRNSNELRITIALPVDYRFNTNYQFLTISGVDQYNNLYLSGRQWRPDRSFEKWGVGYYYEPDSKLLYFMPKHSKQREEILINF